MKAHKGIAYDIEAVIEIPDSITIGGIEINVILTDGQDTRLGNNFGVWNPYKGEIILNDNLSDNQKLSTFVHEVLEAINSIYDVGLKHHQICLLEVGIFSSGILT